MAAQMKALPLQPTASPGVITYGWGSVKAETGEGWGE